MKKTKITALILALAMLLSSAFCLSTAAEVTEPEAEAQTGPEVFSKNIVYQGNHALLLAIDANSVTNGASGKVSVTVYENADKTGKSYGPFDATYYDGTTGEQDTNGDGVKDAADSCFIVKTQGIAQLDMAKQFYFEAVDGADANKVSELYRYSVAEYFLERTYLGNPNEQQQAMYDNALAYGASVQAVLAPAATPVTDYKLVTIKDGKFADGYTRGVYANGTNLTLVPDGEVESWKITNYATNAETSINTNSLLVSDSVAITVGSVPFVLGQGAYFNGNVENFENYNGVAYNYDSGAASDYANNEFWTNAEAMNVSLKSESENGILSINRILGNKSTGVNIAKEVTSDTLVFESDIRFASGYTTTETSYDNLRLAQFGFYTTRTSDGQIRTDEMPVMFLLNAILGDEVVGGEEGERYVAGVGLGYDSHSNFVTLDVGKWYNLRIVAHRDPDASTFTVDIYVNGVKEINNDGVSYRNSSGIGGSNKPDMSGHINGFGLLTSGYPLFDLQLDNTYIGGYEEPYQPGDASLYYNNPGSYVGVQNTFTDDSAFAWKDSTCDQNGANLSVSDGVLTDGGFGNHYHRYTLPGATSPASGNKHVIETDIFFSAETAAKIVSTASDRYVLGYIGPGHTEKASNGQMIADIWINALTDSEENVTGIGISHRTASTANSSDLSTIAKLELNKWYNLRIEIEVTSADGGATVKVYLNGTCVSEKAGNLVGSSSNLPDGVNTDIVCFGVQTSSGRTDNPITAKFTNMFYGTIPAETQE